MEGYSDEQYIALLEAKIDVYERTIEKLKGELKEMTNLVLGVDKKR